jgi:hypothetical protein
VASWNGLQARVTALYRQLDLPAWPDPHPGGAEARDEEYSRLTDPDRYAVVHARARIWADVLADELGAAREPISRGARITSPLPGTLPLVLLERDDSHAVLEIGVAGPDDDVVLEIVPDCGCDACDRGSDDLLEAIDQYLRMIVAGPLVVLRGRGWHGHWYPDGGSASNTDLDWVMDTGRRLADGAEPTLSYDTVALVGRAWI